MVDPDSFALCVVQQFLEEQGYDAGHALLHTPCNATFDLHD